MLQAIAFRNAVFTSCAKSSNKESRWKEIKDVAVGKAFDLEDKRNRAIEFFFKKFKC